MDWYEVTRFAFQPFNGSHDFQKCIIGSVCGLYLCMVRLCANKNQLEVQIGIVLMWRTPHIRRHSIIKLGKLEFFLAKCNKMLVFPFLLYSSNCEKNMRPCLCCCLVIETTIDDWRELIDWCITEILKLDDICVCVCAKVFQSCCCVLLYNWWEFLVVVFR